MPCKPVCRSLYDNTGSLEKRRWLTRPVRQYRATLGAMGSDAFLGESLAESSFDGRSLMFSKSVSCFRHSIIRSSRTPKSRKCLGCESGRTCQSVRVKEHMRSIGECRSPKARLNLSCKYVASWVCECSYVSIADPCHCQAIYAGCRLCQPVSVRQRVSLGGMKLTRVSNAWLAQLSMAGTGNRARWMSMTLQLMSCKRDSRKKER